MILKSATSARLVGYYKSRRLQCRPTLYPTTSWPDNLCNKPGLVVRAATVSRIMRGHVMARPFPLSSRTTDVRPGCKPQRIAPTLRKDESLIRLGEHHLGGMAFETEDDLISELRNRFDNLDVDFFRVGINSLLSRWQKCIDLHGDYVEK
ncbi:histone-lysine N-methyltransferase SETMAR [Plakobranchus ocellatus]|uniref:Histone-lysine N-methyltransferase SETMAR n=1 Tax=Plakobranchus ocellatus TaxID=259542 RepID=A0AAV4D4T6_9GAST|nr:histone-lysine N-methyltransferase SETMAR [Plakobranchus ocellatus]